MGRILESLLPTAHAAVRVEIADEAERQPLPSRAHIDLEWIFREEQVARGSDALVDAVRDVDWSASGTRVFAWAGCEHRAFRSLRGYFREERKLKREEHLVAARQERRRCARRRLTATLPPHLP